MLNIALYEPEIPPNTGNIIRLCANTGCTLHLIEPLGFDLDDKKLKRAGLDYHEWASVQIHADIRAMDSHTTGTTYAVSTRGNRYYTDAEYQVGDTLVFGPETRGLPAQVLAGFTQQHVLRIPMLEHSRSLNLSNTVAVVVYEALRQCGFEGLS